MIPVITYLLCVYLIFKGVEIFQIAFMSSRSDPQRATGIVIGVGAITVAVAAALFFAWWITDISLNAGNTLPKLP
jgi:NADH:ubiquinone oxidoreductase subunit K